MAIAWQSANFDPTTSTSDTQLDVTAPTGITVGDILVAFGGCASAKTITPPAGWTQQANDDNTVSRIYVWTKTADSSDAVAATFSFPCGTFGAAEVAVHRMSGASTNTPTMAFGTGTNSQTQTAPTITTPSAGCLVFWGAYHQANQTTSTADKGTERIDGGNSTSGCWMAQYTNVEASAGSVTGATITTSGFGAKRVYSVAFEASSPPAAPIGVIVSRLQAVRRSNLY